LRRGVYPDLAKKLLRNSTKSQRGKSPSVPLCKRGNFITKRVFEEDRDETGTVWMKKSPAVIG
jgi:hypothetical protein